MTNGQLLMHTLWQCMPCLDQKSQMRTTSANAGDEQQQTFLFCAALRPLMPRLFSDQVLSPNTIDATGLTNANKSERNTFMCSPKQTFCLVVTNPTSCQLQHHTCVYEWECFLQKKKCMPAGLPSAPWPEAISGAMSLKVVGMGEPLQPPFAWICCNRALQCLSEASTLGLPIMTTCNSGNADIEEILLAHQILGIQLQVGLFKIRAMMANLGSKSNCMALAPLAPLAQNQTIFEKYLHLCRVLLFSCVFIIHKKCKAVEMSTSRDSFHSYDYSASIEHFKHTSMYLQTAMPLFMSCSASMTYQ